MSGIKDFYNSLNCDIKQKLKACKSQEEMLKVLKDEHIELGEDLLKSVSGGEGCYAYEMSNLPTFGGYNDQECTEQACE